MSRPGTPRGSGRSPMAQRKRRRSAPFVLTLTAVAAANPLACGGRAMTSSTDPARGGAAGDGTGATSASGASSGSETGGSGAFAGAGGHPSGSGGSGVGAVGGVSTGGSGGSIGVCPEERPLNWDVPSSCALSAGEVCTYVQRCQSGTITFVYTCESNTLQLQRSSCVPYDSCPGTGLWCTEGGLWWDTFDQMNPPAPCPAARPADGASCYQGSLGAEQTPCGYRCGNGSWRISACVASDAGSTLWQSDGVCQTGE
jgi:hypothetical protein